MGTTEQYCIVKSPKKAGNGDLSLIKNTESLTALNPLTFDITHLPGEAILSSNNLENEYSKS